MDETDLSANAVLAAVSGPGGCYDMGKVVNYLVFMF